VAVVQEQPSIPCIAPHSVNCSKHNTPHWRDYDNDRSHTALNDE